MPRIINSRTLTGEKPCINIVSAKPAQDLTYHISTIRFQFSCYYPPNNYLTKGSLLALITLNSAFEHISLIHSDDYK